MMILHDLIHYLDTLLDIKSNPDLCPNGLQIFGSTHVNKIITGVTACQALLDAAIEKNADTILVHHGYFWQGEDPCVTGIKYNRLATLIKNNINLIACHLPLDSHVVYGNNVQLAKILNINVDSSCLESNVAPNYFFTGKPDTPQKPDDFVKHINHCLKRMPLHIAGKSTMINAIAWCAGAGQNFIDQAIENNVDAFLTGEITEKTVHIARENHIHLFVAGHHATERYGIKALGEHLAKQFQIEHQFIDIDSPI